MAALAIYIFIVLLVNFTFAYFTFKDANRRGHDGTAWIILVMLFGIFAVLIYLLQRNDTIIEPQSSPKSDSVGNDVEKIRSVKDATDKAIIFLKYFGAAIIAAGFLWVLGGSELSIFGYMLGPICLLFFEMYRDSDSKDVYP